MLLEDVGNDVYKSWSTTKRRAEIAKLVEGYRSGLPAFILCRMTETIAGSRKRARRFLHEMMPTAERQEAAARENGPTAEFVRDCLL